MTFGVRDKINEIDSDYIKKLFRYVLLVIAMIFVNKNEYITTFL